MLNTVTRLTCTSLPSLLNVSEIQCRFRRTSRTNDRELFFNHTFNRLSLMTESSPTNFRSSSALVNIAPSSMSLEKRFRSRPIGVTSKNDIGLRRILNNTRSCSLVDARNVTCNQSRTSFIVIY